MTLNLIAHYYDLIHRDLDEDLPLWLNLAAEAGGPVLEVGCGTGRLLLPLAQAGHTLTGLDLSDTALAAAQTKLDSAGIPPSQVSLVQADMRHFSLPAKNFAIALLPLNTLMHCHTIDDQLAVLKNIRQHLRPNGQLVIDLFFPDAVMLAEEDGRLYYEADLVNEHTGHSVQWFWRHQIDAAAQMRHLVYILDELAPDGTVHRVSLPLSLRFFYRFEMELLLSQAGFVVDAILGDYDMHPFDEGSPRMIFVARTRP